VKQCKVQQQNGKYTARLQSKKRNSNQSHQSRYYSHFYLKTKQEHTNYAIRAAKRTGNALGNFMKLSSLPDEST
jgi:arginine repressor